MGEEVVQVPSRRTEGRAMKSRDKLVTIGFAAKDMGIDKIEYPVFQAFAYYLKQRLGFSDYLFNGCAYPRSRQVSEAIEFPCSVELTEDLNRLVSHGLFEERAGSTAYVVTERAEALRERYIDKLESEALLHFDDLRTMAGELLSSPEVLLAQSYRLYIRGLA